jgi:hypothetical protein
MKRSYASMYTGSRIPLKVHSDVVARRTREILLRRLSRFENINHADDCLRDVKYPLVLTHGRLPQ